MLEKVMPKLADNKYASRHVAFNVVASAISKNFDKLNSKSTEFVSKAK